MRQEESPLGIQFTMAKDHQLVETHQKYYLGNTKKAQRSFSFYLRTFLVPV